MSRRVVASLVFVLAACLAGGFAAADTGSIPVGTSILITLKSGGKVKGSLLYDLAHEVCVKTSYATVKVRRGDIVSMDVQQAGGGVAVIPNTGRLPAWSKVVDELALRPYAKDLRQIPATVVDVGVFKFVPYNSHRAGPYEFNVYGDPDRPAGVEMGIVKGAPMTDAAKAEVVALLGKLLSDAEDQALLKTLKLDEDTQTRSGITFDVTPPTGEDAYGGWWISIWHVGDMDLARAKPDEIKVITVRLGGGAGGADPLAWEQDDYKEARPGAQGAAGKPAEPPSAVDAAVGGPAPKPAAGAPGSAEAPWVYVRGYHRVGGRYVGPE